MNPLPRHRAPLWASLLLLLTFAAAQPLLAEHIHIDEAELTFCELGFNHMSAAVGSKLKFVPSGRIHFCPSWQTAPILSAQPQRQSARAPPVALLSFH